MIYVVSDIHGCLKTFLRLLEKVNFSKNDKLYILGDIIDRGPFIYETYEWVKERLGKNVFMIMGNHEDMFITDVFTLKGKEIYNKKVKNEFFKNEEGLSQEEQEYLDHYNKYRFVYDQYGTIQFLFHCGYSLDDLLEMAKFFKALPDYYIENVNGKDIRLIHAYCKKNLNETTHDDFIWGRDFAETDEFCEGETVIYGHTPTIFDGKDGNIEICINEQINAVKVNIDCGCVYGNKLCILRLDDMRYWYQKVIDDE